MATRAWSNLVREVEGVAGRKWHFKKKRSDGGIERQAQVGRDHMRHHLGHGSKTGRS